MRIFDWSRRDRSDAVPRQNRGASSSAEAADAGMRSDCALTSELESVSCQFAGSLSEHGTSDGILKPGRNGHGDADRSPQRHDTVDLERQRAAIVGRIRHLSPTTDAYATEFVERLLEFAGRVRTSDVHFQPTLGGLVVRFRNDGVLHLLGEFPSGASSSIVSRLKVLSNLLTYRSDIPQEGRLQSPGDSTEIRVSTYPTLHGERAVLRFFGHGNQYRHLNDLGHTPEVTESLIDCLAETSGALLICGPAGSGKSTTLYASLRHLVRTTGGARNLMSLEDPIEVPIEGVSQSQVNQGAGFDLHVGLRSLLRQDPEVIMIGEIRDPVTAEIAIQASLTGQLMLTSFHADSAVTAVSRLLDMGIEPYLLRSGVIGVCCQRLLRKLCHCSEESHDGNDFYGLPIDWCRTPAGCEACGQSGYQGRMIVSEFLSLRDAGLAGAVLDTKDSRQTYRIAVEHGMKSLWERATELVREGTTSPAEVRRVLGVAMRI
ncbi:Putative type II secretion system protein E [Stieleria maiorica]|uniref:Type II secretion system protein E n=1 Tax=Stieleria maiorica TaxID=2795974 RepID=A0A5B9MJI0_9BACT|nr:GspE/PulE family protein [Stieleria maiorica]QEF99197.1 Putative type II secretion system protein E [Stieleria maiorica]